MGEGGVLNGNSPVDGLDLLIVQILIIIITSRVLSLGLRYMRQPTVIAEVLGGIFLGPSVLGYAPGFQKTIFPESAMSNLSLVANLGLIFYLFLVGLELDLSAMKARYKESLVISATGMLFPFALSVGTAYLLYTQYMGGTQYSFALFWLFIAVGMSITAFPVLARILGELHMLSSPVGIKVISAAALGDAAAWGFLALVIGVVHATNPLNALYVVLLTITFTAIMLLLVRPLAARLLERGIRSDGSISEWVVISVMTLVLLSAYITDIIGVHQIFGAFLAGLIVPRAHGIDVLLTEKIEDLVSIVFLPLYFAFSGLQTNIGLIDDGLAWGLAILVLLTACVGKILGCFIAAKMLKLGTREAWTIGMLMNTRGLVELIVLNVGLQAGVIDSKVFAIMVLMAVVTTFMTTPIVSVIYPARYYRKTTTAEEEIDASGDSLEAIVKRHIRPIICLPGLGYAPTMMNVIKLMFNSGEKTSVHAVRMIEVSDRPSSIMKATHLVDNLKDDPVVNVITTFGAMNHLNVKPYFSITSADEMSADLQEIATSNSLNTVFVPWIGKEKSSRQDSSVGNMNHHTVVRTLLKNWPKTVAVVLDRGINVPTGTEEFMIMVPFFGGPDCREALTLALRMAAGHERVKIHILHIAILMENGDYNAYEDAADDELLEKVCALNGSEPTEFFKSVTIQYEQVKAASQDVYDSLLEHLRVQTYSLVLFGWIGPTWVRLMALKPVQDEDADQQKTVSSVVLRNLQQLITFNGNNAQATHSENSLPGPVAAAVNHNNNQSTIRSMRSFITGAHRDSHNSDLNQLSVPMTNMRSSSRDDGRSTPKENNKSNVRAVIGETGKAIWKSDVVVSMIAVRKVKVSA